MDRVTTHIDLKRVSPYDTGEQTCAPLVQIQTRNAGEAWVPSRFNARTIQPSGEMVLWNTLSGNFNVFAGEQRKTVEGLLSRKGFSGSLSVLGKYLHERGYLVPRGTNEYRQFQMSFGEQHYRADRLELILLASEDCNFRCSYCYEDFKRGTMEPKVRENLKALVRTRIPTLRHLSINWFGGEPLYGFSAIEDLAPFFQEQAAQHRVSYAAGITTNGYLLTPDVADKLIRWNVRQFQVTLDGPREQHDVNRPARDGSGTFDTILENLTALHASPKEFLVRLRINFDRGNHPRLDDLLAQLEQSFGGDPRFSVAFHPVGQWGGEKDDSLPVFGCSEATEVRSQLQQDAARRGIPFGNLAEKSRLGGQACYAARPYNLVIGAKGQVMKCTVALDKDPGNVVGQLGEAGELILDRERFSRWVEPIFESDTACQKCHLLPSCQGLSCPLIRFEKGVSPCEATCKTSLHTDLTGAVLAKIARKRIVQGENGRSL